MTFADASMRSRFPDSDIFSHVRDFFPRFFCPQIVLVVDRYSHPRLQPRLPQGTPVTSVPGVVSTAMVNGTMVRVPVFAPSQPPEPASFAVVPLPTQQVFTPKTLSGVIKKLYPGAVIKKTRCHGKYHIRFFWLSSVLVFDPSWMNGRTG